MTDKCRGGPTEWQEERPPIGPRNWFYLSLHLFSLSLFFLTMPRCVKKHKMPLFCAVTTNAIKYEYIKNIVIINHSLHFHIVSGSTYVSETATEDYCQKPEKTLDKWTLQSNGKSVWSPINHSTGDCLKDLLFTNSLVWDPDKIIDCEAVKMAWLRRCIDHKSKTFQTMQLLWVIY